MAWQDRNYNNSELNYGGSPPSHPILKLFLGSVPIGTWFGIPVRVHAMLLWFLGFQLLQARSDSYGWQGALASAVMLFVIVLLHEFGHCAGAKFVGGHSDQIVLWPLGGLAYSSTDRTPWARFVTVVSGPLVNVLIGVVLFCVMYFGWSLLPPLHPLYAWSSTVRGAYWAEHGLAISRIYGGQWLVSAFAMNLTILFFNLIPMYPLDGGKLMQIALWRPLGYFKSMNFTCIASMVLAVLLAVWGISEGTLFTAAIGIFAFLSCLGERRLLKYTAAESLPDSGYDLSAAFEHPDSPRRKKLKKSWLMKARKRAEAEQVEQAKIDTILAKVKEKGLHSLTWWEKRALRKATERQRQQDLAERM